jgi:crotonobetainyl-CoA:carnitine CoA-transferase CaiB-like acyl-CoA transferase
MASGRDAGRSGSETPMLAPYRAFHASDRYLVIAAGNDSLFRRLCEVVGKPEWANDRRFRSNADRVGNRDMLNTLLEAEIMKRTADEWTTALSAVGVPCAPLQSPTEVIAHPQTEALGMLQPTPDGTMKLVASPLRFDGARPQIRAPAPDLGADLDRVARVLSKASNDQPVERLS